MPNGVVADLLTLVPVAATLRVVEQTGRVSRRERRRRKSIFEL